MKEEQKDLRRVLREARLCFAERRYFDAHEVLEEAWREARGADRATLQGLIQAAAAWHHVTRGNMAGARSLAAKALTRLERAPDHWHGFPVMEIRRAMMRWRGWLESDMRAQTPDLPRLLDRTASRKTDGRMP